jgi:acetolactate synthase-1/2/3 large subunit
MVRQWQEQFYERNYSGVNLLGPDFVKMAEAYGIPCESICDTDSYEKAVQNAQKYQGPYIIHAVVEKEENVFPMVAPATGLGSTLYYPEKKDKNTKKNKIEQRN